MRLIVGGELVALICRDTLLSTMAGTFPVYVLLTGRNLFSRKHSSCRGKHKIQTQKPVLLQCISKSIAPYCRTKNVWNRQWTVTSLKVIKNFKIGKVWKWSAKKNLRLRKCTKRILHISYLHQTVSFNRVIKPCRDWPQYLCFWR